MLGWVGLCSRGTVLDSFASYSIPSPTICSGFLESDLAVSHHRVPLAVRVVTDGSDKQAAPGTSAKCCSLTVGPLVGWVAPSWFSCLHSITSTAVVDPLADRCPCPGACGSASLMQEQAKGVPGCIG